MRSTGNTWEGKGRNEFSSHIFCLFPPLFQTFLLLSLVCPHISCSSPLCFYPPLLLPDFSFFGMSVPPCLWPISFAHTSICSQPLSPLVVCNFLEYSATLNFAVMFPSLFQIWLIKLLLRTLETRSQRCLLITFPLLQNTAEPDSMCWFMDAWSLTDTVTPFFLFFFSFLTPHLQQQYFHRVVLLWT